MIELADKWTRQPQRFSAPELDFGWKGRLWRGSVLAAYPFNSWQNVAIGPLRAGTLPQFEGTVTSTVAEWGTAQGTAGGSRVGRKYAGIATLSTFTMSALVRFTSVSGIQVITGNDDGNAQGARIQCNGGTFQITHLAQANVDLSVGAFSANTAYFIAVTHDGANDYWVVKNLSTGAVTSGSVADTFTPFAPNSGWCPVGYGRLTTESVDGSVGGVFVSSAVLTAAELLQWAQNPHAVFAKRPKRIFVTTGGSSGVTGTAAVTLGNDTSSATGTTTVKGTAAPTLGNDTSSATGVVGSVSGTAAITLGNDTSSAQGTTSIGGTGAVTLGNDTCSASGAVGSAITGTAAITLGSDTSSATGTTKILGSSAIILGADFSTTQGTTKILGSAAIILGDDFATAFGTSGTPTTVSSPRGLTIRIGLAL